MRNLQAEDLLALRSVGDIRTSPTEERVVYVEEWLNAEDNTTCHRIRTIMGTSEAKDLTQGTTDTHPRFCHDGRRLAFLREVEHVAQIWILPLDGGEARCVTHFPGGVDDFDWSADGTRLAIVARVDKDGSLETPSPATMEPRSRHTRDVKVITELYHKLDGDGYFDPFRPCLFLLDVTGVAQPAQLTQFPYRVSEARFAPDASAIIFRSRRGVGYDRGSEEGLFSIDLEGNTITELVPPGVQAFIIAPNGSVVYTWDDPASIGYDQARLFHLESAGAPPRPVVPEFEYPFGNEAINDVLSPPGDSLAWDVPGESLFALVSQRGSVDIMHITLGTETIETITSGNQVVSSFARSPIDNTLYAVITTSSKPSDIYRIADDDLVQCTSTNTALLAEVEFLEPHYLQIPSPEGHTIDAWVYLPPKSYDQPVPGVVEIHGGPMAMYAHAFFFEFQLLAHQGFAVIASNPRGSRGYGADYCHAIYDRWGDRDWADIETVVDSVCQQYPSIDPNALGVGGGSYGGYLTAWIVGHSDRYRAGVMGRPVTDWVSMVGSSDGGWEEFRRAGGVPPWEDPSWYREQSPLTYVASVHTPVLIEAQEGDLRCPLEQAMEYYTALRYLDQVPVRFVRYPQEFHGMSRNGKPWNRIHRLDEIVTWYQRFLQPSQPS